VLDLLKNVASILDISSNDFSFLSLKDIFDINRNADIYLIKQELLHRIHMNQRQYDDHLLIILPHVLSKPTDFSVVNVPEGLPNYITSKSVRGEILQIEEVSDRRISVVDRIIVLEKADPGYDWIFANESIKGLVTKYGGMGSHMAIRCMEHGIPAAIGCGELLYDEIKNSKEILLNCSEKKMVILN